MIDDDVILGNDVHIFAPQLVNIYGCRIGDGTFVGPFVEITRGVLIGKNCKITSHSYICDAVTLEDDVFVGHGVVFTNDLYPQVGNHVAYLKTLVRQGARLGSNSTIIGGVTIGRYAVVGGGAVVTSDVSDFSVVAGNPARVTRQFDSLEAMTAYVRGRQPLRGLS